MSSVVSFVIGVGVGVASCYCYQRFGGLDALMLLVQWARAAYQPIPEVQDARSNPAVDLEAAKLAAVPLSERDIHTVKPKKPAADSRTARMKADFEAKQKVSHAEAEAECRTGEPHFPRYCGYAQEHAQYQAVVTGKQHQQHKEESS